MITRARFPLTILAIDPGTAVSGWCVLRPDDSIETIIYTGMLMQAWPGKLLRVKRSEVKRHLCGSLRAKDANVRQAIIDRYGGQAAIGRKATPGPLYGVTSHAWAALAVAITAREMGIDTSA